MEFDTGDLVVIEAVAPSGRTSDLVADGSGTCHIVIIASPTCGACASARDQWVRDAVVLGAEEVEVPGWTRTWVVMADEETTSEFRDARLPAHLRWTPDAALVARFGLTAVPAYVLLDRDGRLVQAGTGAPFPLGHATSGGCTLDGEATE